MPLRDHFRPPIWKKCSREGFHGMWPATIVQRLVNHLPEECPVGTRIQLRRDLQSAETRSVSNLFSKDTLRWA